MKGQVSVEGAFRPTSHQAGGGSAVPEGQGSSLGVSMTPGEAHLICRSPGEPGPPSQGASGSLKVGK